MARRLTWPQDAERSSAVSSPLLPFWPDSESYGFSLPSMCSVEARRTELFTAELSEAATGVAFIISGARYPKPSLTLRGGEQSTARTNCTLLLCPLA